MQQFESALRDAEVALSLEPRWMKGLFRKGKALCGLKVKLRLRFLLVERWCENQASQTVLTSSSAPPEILRGLADLPGGPGLGQFQR